MAPPEETETGAGALTPSVAPLAISKLLGLGPDPVPDPGTSTRAWLCLWILLRVGLAGGLFGTEGVFFLGLGLGPIRLTCWTCRG